MIFLTVGSQKFPFDRLITAIDDLIQENKIQEEVFAQIGTATYEPKHMNYKKFLNQAEFKQKLEECDIVITHGGTGVIVQAIEKGKKVIGVPRKKEFGEHVDNHQEELIGQFSDMNLILRCDDVDKLENCLEALNEFIPQKYYSNTQTYIEELESCLMSIEREKRQYRIKRKFTKYIEYLTTKIKVLYKQKKFFDGSNTLKYMYYQNNSDVIAFVFSSCTRIGVKARYNYVRTMASLPIDRMFILDDFGEDHRGSFYTGKNMDFTIEQSTIKLIRQIIQKGKYKKVLFVGSSKGGYAALNLGMQIPKSIIIAGAPQYRLGDYLMDESNHLEKTLQYISGKGYRDITSKEIQELNEHLEKRIQRTSIAGEKPTIYLHYSNKEHTYEEHIRELLQKLKENNYKVKEDVEQYGNHSDISLYFPKFILSCINEVLKI